MVRHVDDKVCIVTSKRIMDFMVAVLKEAFVCEYGPWSKVLGWDAVIDKEEHTVCFECPSVLVAARTKFASTCKLARACKLAREPAWRHLRVSELETSWDDGKLIHAPIAFANILQPVTHQQLPS